MVIAAIAFTQGGNVGAPGVAMLGVRDVPVACRNGNDSGVASQTWMLRSVPLGSALPVGGTVTGATFEFTPDTDFCYLVRLVVVGIDGSTALDERVFGVPDAQGRLVPAFEGAGSAHNFPGNTRGWAGTDSVKMADWMLANAGAGAAGPVVATMSISIFYVNTAYPRQLGGTLLHADFVAAAEQSWAVEIAYQTDASARLTFMVADAETQQLLGSVQCGPSEVPAVVDMPLDVSGLDISKRHLIALLGNCESPELGSGLCIGALLIGRSA
jgi:hypothetical protein